MNVIVCNDARSITLTQFLGRPIRTSDVNTLEKREQLRRRVNEDQKLCALLEEDRHNVRLFDGHRDGDLLTKVLEPARLADDLRMLIMDHAAQCMVFDLQWFTTNGVVRGMQILRELFRTHSVPSDMQGRLIVFSKFANQPGVASQLEALGIPNENIIVRGMNDIFFVRDRIAVLEK